MSARIISATEGVGEAAMTLRAGGIVAFPTETVYGLGADALDPAAVAKIYAAKGRPASNPLIVHVGSYRAIGRLIRQWPPVAEILAKKFWPGPLTIVLEKSDIVPDIITAGGPTVAIRIPGHPIALDLLARLGDMPIAAPSANRSEELSPTTANHVAESLGPFVDDLLILDGGATSVGLESTVIDVTGKSPRLLRPGMISAAMLQDAIGHVLDFVTVEDAIARSPGRMARHYAPRAPLEIVPTRHLDASVRGDQLEDFEDGVLLFSYRSFFRKRVITMPQTADAYATRLYAALREMDASNVRRILVEEPPDTPEWAAIHDRLRRAAAKKGISE